MPIFVDEHQAAGQVRARARTPLRARRPAGEPRRPPGRARVVVGRRRPAVPDCAPRPVAPRWPWLVVTAVCVGLTVAGLGLLAEGVPGGVPGRTAIVPVGRGQTLWDLARQYAPDSDPEAVVARIRQLNGLGDATLVPGLPLTVPVGSPAVDDPP